MEDKASTELVGDTNKNRVNCNLPEYDSKLRLLFFSFRGRWSKSTSFNRYIHSSLSQSWLQM